MLTLLCDRLFQLVLRLFELFGRQLKTLVDFRRKWFVKRIIFFLRRKYGGSVVWRLFARLFCG